MKLSQIHNHLPKRSLLIASAILVSLSFLTAWFFQSKPSIEHQQRLLQQHVTEQQQDATALLSDTNLLRRLILHKESLEEFKAINNKKYGFFVFAETLSENPDLVFWNKQEMLPPSPNFEELDGIKFQQLVNGYFIIHKSGIGISGMSSNLVAYVLIPVVNKYYFESDFPTQFAHNKDAIKKITLAERSTEFAIKSIDGKTLFHLQPADSSSSSYADPLTLILRLLALVMLLVYLHLIVEKVNQKRGAVAAVATLFTALLICRLIIFWYPEIFSLRQLSLFDPSVYASDFINRSLGDLLISALFLCWVVVYAWSSISTIKGTPSFLQGKGFILAGIAAVFLLIFTTFQLANLIYDLVGNSKISFDVTNFFQLTQYSVFGFVVLAVLSLTYYYFSRLLFRFIIRCFPNLIYLYFTIAVIGLIFLTVRTGELIVLFYLPVLGWLIVYTLLLTQEQLIINRLRITIAGILFWIFIFSVSLSLLMIKANEEKEWRTRRAIAGKYEQVSDPTKEETLNIALAFLTNDFIKNNFNRFYNEPENTILRDSFIRINWLGYANSYNTNFYVFDANSNPINNKDNRTYHELNNILEVQSKPTGKSNIYYYQTSFDEFIYITRRPAYDNDRLIGTLFIVAAPKHFENAEDLYPTIFQRGSIYDLENSPDYSYAIYNNLKLSNHSSKYSFPTEISPADVPDAEITSIKRNNNTELWYKASRNKIVVIAKKNNALMEGITMFSYLFCSFLFMVGLLRMLSFIAQLSQRRLMAGLLAGQSIRTQIHGTIIFISVLSFLIIGAATISFFINRYKQNDYDRLSRTASGAVKEMEQRVNEANLLINNSINFQDTTSAKILDSVIEEIGDVHGLVVNIYDLKGNLQVTSDKKLYQEGWLSYKIHPQAFYHMNTLKQVQYVQDENISQVKYQSIYIAMRNVNGETYAYLNVPSFYSQIGLNQEISNFIVTIINLNAFIFLIAGVIALFITNRITRSFSLIGDKMKAITLGKTNEEIVWTRDDEIGELVTQYNKMVHQLEQSANALAKSEREGAWREMARQVAHEIKNPLTPMKLSIQYLQRAIQQNQPNVQQLTSNVASTLIEQIDHLSKIAADFSQFANIGNKKVEEIDLHSVIRSLVDLYSSNPRMKLQWNQLPQAVRMRADKTHMNRLFTNLLTNAVDACSEARECHVLIDERIEASAVIVSVKDNGEGIPEEMRSKIFTPNFTTKSSGTGLGLAMCKSIVEQAGGSIWFETEEGVGTSFFVRLPLSN